MMDRRIYGLHAEMCSVFTSAKRLEILDLLRTREMSVGEIARATGLAQSNLSQHLAMLREKGMVKTRREGVVIYYSLANPRIMEAFDIVTSVLLDRLGETEKLSRDVRKSAKGK